MDSWLVLQICARKQEVGSHACMCACACACVCARVRVCLQVYGAMLWSLSRVLGTPEAKRTYVSSFWDKPIRFASLPSGPPPPLRLRVLRCMLRGAGKVG